MINQDFRTITDIIRVIMVGKDEYPQKKITYSHDLEQTEMLFHLSGHTTIYYNDAVVETYPGTITFLPRGKTDRYEVVQHERGSFIDVFFNTDFPVVDRACSVNVRDNEHITLLFKKLFAHWIDKEDGYRFKCLSLLYSVFAELTKSYYSPKQHYDLIKPAVDAIHENFSTKELTTEQLAKLCGISVSYLKQLFSKTYSMPPRKYIINLKIKNACELLKHGGYSISQVAALCRYSDVYFFSRQFKEYMGITPTQFIKKYRSSKE